MVQIKLWTDFYEPGALFDPSYLCHVVYPASTRTLPSPQRLHFVVKLAPSPTLT